MTLPYRPLPTPGECNHITTPPTPVLLHGQALAIHSSYHQVYKQLSPSLTRCPQFYPYILPFAFSYGNVLGRRVQPTTLG